MTQDVDVQDIDRLLKSAIGRRVHRVRRYIEYRAGVNGDGGGERKASLGFVDSPGSYVGTNSQMLALKPETLGGEYDGLLYVTS